MKEDTIAGIATAAGEGGVAIVRVSGPEAERVLERVFQPARRKPPYESHKLMYGHIADGEAWIDEAMGVLMRAPATYTREDVCELHTHGGSAAATAALRLCLRAGARLAEPGEFTRRAFLNGRIDLTQAEAVMGVIGASSEAALRSEAAQLGGGQSRFLRAAQEKLIALLSGVEAHIDYPDEISELEAVGELRGGLNALIGELSSAADERGARILREGLRVALCGRPNAGKSTLFNALLGEERAIVTSVPGTTRDVLEGAFTLNGLTMRLMDTAGLREAGDEAERIGVERARRAVKQADAALLVLDAAEAPDAETLDLLQGGWPCPCAVLLNKEDARPVLTAMQIETLTALRPVLTISAKTGLGLDHVKAFLAERAKLPTGWLMTHERHLDTARQVIKRLTQAREALDAGQPLDLIAVDLRDALALLGRITGDTVDERLLDEIFSRFCVGK